MYCDQPSLLTRDPGGGVDEEIPHRWANSLPTNRILLFCPPVGYFFIYPTTWISRQKTPVGHSTSMSVLARRRAIMGSIVQPKRSCLGLSRCCHVLVTVHAGASQGYVLGIPLHPTGRSST